MSWVAVGTTALKIGSDLYSNNQNKKAAAAQGQAAQQGIDKIQGFYDEAKGYMQPYMNTGIIANNGLAQLLGGDYSGFYNSPDYKAAMQSGGDMLDNSAASRGMLFSGAHQKDLSNFGQQMAAQYLGNYRNFLGGTAGMGLNASSTLGGFGADAGNSIANLLGQGGSARASAYQANGMNGAGMMGSLGSMFGSIMGNRGGGGANISMTGGSSMPMFQNNTQMPSLYGPPKLNY